MEHQTPQNPDELSRLVNKNINDGFVPIVPSSRVYSVDSVDNSFCQQWINSESLQRNEAASVNANSNANSIPNDGMRRGGLMGNNAAMLDFSQQLVVPTPDSVGTPGKGYIKWGNYNDQPSRVIKLSSSQPYTASALQYLADTATGLGVRLMYWLSRYSGGTVTEEYIPYEKAGVYLRNRKRELLSRIASLENENIDNGSNATEQNASTQLLSSYRDELEGLEQNILDWERTMLWYDDFKQHNNIDQHYQALIADDVRLDMCYPTVVISRGRANVWNPTITGIGVMDAVCVRREQLTQLSDENGDTLNDRYDNPVDGRWLSRYCYYSEQWRDDPFSTRDFVCTNITALPSNDPFLNFSLMSEYVQRNQRTKVSDRKCEWACPLYYPTPDKPIYSQPSWWSIWPSQVFQYCSTLIYDKSIARKNSTMWRKILYINISYLKQLFDQAGADTPEAQQEIRDGIFSQIEEFLRRRDNNGKMLVMDSYMSADEKNLIDSVRIVDVPDTTASKNEDGELAQISSVIFFALGVHPALIGAEPGKTGKSGTFQRELHLLKVTQMSPRQRRILSFYNNILSFNRLDPNAIFCVKQATLTTLDNSKTGVVEDVND